MAKPGQTEKPTEKRKADARKKGQVARSPDIASASVFIAIVVALHAGFNTTVALAAQAFIIAFAHLGHPQAPTIHSVLNLAIQNLTPYIAILLMAFGAAVVIGIAANLAQFGLMFSPHMLKPNFSKLNPITGFSRVMFSPQTLVQLLKQLLKLSVVASIVYSQVHDRLPVFYMLAHASPMAIASTVEDTAFAIGIRFGVLLLILGCADYGWERWRLEQSLMMSKTEIKEESKQSEGSPEAKGAVKQRQRAAARRRMMAAVPRATVVVTNPTHYAIALEWNEDTMAAPVLVAKGADLMAKRIRELAAEHRIPILENPPLARTLYDKVPLDSPVPADLYAAVAQVIAFVYKLKNRTIAS
jgi:flagellar biosynthetic protein FlhB